MSSTFSSNKTPWLFSGCMVTTSAVSDRCLYSGKGISDGCHRQGLSNIDGGWRATRYWAKQSFGLLLFGYFEPLTH
ncbi:hypothetical protein OH492_00885 [Vibrio chagasii]|nr:hypothetical protein [Vibrio chagasii]